MASAAKKTGFPSIAKSVRWARERVKQSPDSAAKGDGVTAEHIQRLGKGRGWVPNGEAGPAVFAQRAAHFRRGVGGQ